MFRIPYYEHLYITRGFPCRVATFLSGSLTNEGSTVPELKPRDAAQH